MKPHAYFMEYTVNSMVKCQNYMVILFQMLPTTRLVILGKIYGGILTFKVSSRLTIAVS